MTRPILKLRPEVKTLWLDALRSGEYSQCHSMLRGPDGFCCLGVLSDIHSKTEQGKPWVEQYEYDDDEREDALVGYKYEGEGEVPSEGVMDWAFENYKITDDRCVSLVRDASISDTLAGKNDEGKTFVEIADLIEEHL